jgi:mono/diheme cytochrome c family protein
MNLTMNQGRSFWSGPVGCWLAAFIGLLPLALTLPAAEKETAADLLERHCVECHSGDKVKGGLDLATREGLLRGGESGAAIDKIKPDESLLLQMVRGEKKPAMPHKRDRLAPDAIRQLAEWVRAGTPYPRTLKAVQTEAKEAATTFTISETDRKHWAFQPVQRPAVPAVKNETWASNPIDRFILAKLEAAGLQPSPKAAKETLIRRVALDFVGLPPTPAEIDAFVNDSSPRAYENLIDRLLASPHYGERWGRHWLDLARFAETDGYEHDAVRPHSWRYRDYVIRSFNADKPYDQFIREQLAGDELYASAKSETRNPELLVATGFNLLGPDMVDSADQIQRRLNTLNDMTDTTALVFFGQTMGCARCHDHKFEPIAQRDYYALQAFFTPAAFKRETPIPTAAERAAYEAAMTKHSAHPTVLELAAVEAPYREKLRQQKLAKLSPEAREAHLAPPEKRTTEQENQVLETSAMLEITEKELTAAVRGDDKARRKDLQDELKKLPKPPSLPMTMSLASSNGIPARTHMLHRGDYSQPRDVVEANFPSVLRGPGSTGQIKAGAGGSGTRVALADWLVSSSNPLTARVMVNRIWQHHFGRGLVATTSDFGTRGRPPTHPELLDWLASEFVARGWSLKQMHKLMLMSATYQQSSVAADVRRLTSSQTPDAIPHSQKSQSLLTSAATKDPENQLYSRMNRMRLEGEVIRDSLLAISGGLNLTMGGPGVFPPIPAELFKGAKGWTSSGKAGDQQRRSIYIFARRNLRFPFLEVFDAPDSNLSCPERGRSTTAPQSLTLLNAEEVVSAAHATAKRLERDAATREEQVALAYRLTLGRPPSEREQTLAREFLQRSPLHEFCRVLFNLNAFVYVE